jgi:hypothetical protein
VDCVEDDAVVVAVEVVTVECMAVVDVVVATVE